MTDVIGAGGSSTNDAAVGLVKAPTGIGGFDEIIERDVVGVVVGDADRSLMAALRWADHGTPVGR